MTASTQQWVITTQPIFCNSLHPPQDVTLRSFSADLLAGGAFRDTLDEIQRLNPQYRPNTILVAYQPGGFNTGFVTLSYWVLEDVGGGGCCCCCCCGPGFVEPYLRMTQRNDGAGVVRHPRLAASSNAATSVQHGVSPRVGPSNRYR